MRIADYFSKDDEIASLKAKLKVEGEFHANYHKNKLASLKAKVVAVNKKCEFFRGKANGLEVSRDKLKETSQSVLRVIINLKLEGLLDIDDQEIANRCFVDLKHVRNTIALIKRQAK